MDTVPDADGCRGDFPDPQGSRGAGAELDATNYILRCGPPLRPPLVPLSRRLAPAPSRGSRRGSAAPRRKAGRGAVAAGAAHPRRAGLGRRVGGQRRGDRRRIVRSIAGEAAASGAERERGGGSGRIEPLPTRARRAGARIPAATRRRPAAACQAAVAEPVTPDREARAAAGTVATGPGAAGDRHRYAGRGRGQRPAGRPRQRTGGGGRRRRCPWRGNAGVCATVA